MNYQSLAFFIGLFGSLHCAAMCGPLVMSLPMGSTTWLVNLMQRILYQVGRILTYSIFGLAAGLIGGGFDILGIQQLLSVVSGVLLITVALLHFSGRKASGLDQLQLRLVTPIASKIAHLLSKPYGGLFAGLVHGLLPCGMVYMAIAGSLNTGSPVEGGLFMTYFGLGTTPLLLLSSLVPLFFRRSRIPGLVIPLLFFIAGAFLLSRGLNLNIPYVSAPVNLAAPAECR